MKKLSGLIFLLGILFSSCTGSLEDDSIPTQTGADKDRQVILEHTVDSIIIPSYENFESELNNLRSKFVIFKNNQNSQTLKDLQLAWKSAYLGWQDVELFDVGPAQSNSLRFIFNIYPCDTALIEKNLGTQINLNLPSSYPQQGFPALDYFINSRNQTPEQIVNRFTIDSTGPLRIAAMERILDQMQVNLQSVLLQWKGGYRNEFVQKSGVDLNSSFSLLVNGYVLNYERYVRSGKVGIPAGVMQSGVQFPSKTEGYYCRDCSRDLLLKAHQASQRLFEGTSFKGGVNGPSLKSYLQALDFSKSGNSQLATDISSQFNTGSQLIGNLNPDLANQILSGNDKMLELYLEMQKNVRFLKVDLTSAMSITITYTDNDGD